MIFTYILHPFYTYFCHI